MIGVNYNRDETTITIHPIGSVQGEEHLTVRILTAARVVQVTRGHDGVHVGSFRPEEMGRFLDILREALS